MDKHRTSWTILIVALVLMLGGSLLGWWAQTGSGTVKVELVKFAGSYDGYYDAYLFIPNGVTTGHPAPGVLTAHGYNNSKEYMDNTALELARRGYVVLSMDLDKHGLSGSSTTPSAPVGQLSPNGIGALDGLKYLDSLDIVDTNNVGLVGMSMGGNAIEGAAQQLPNGYKALFFMDSNPSVPDKDKNFAVSWGTGSEVPQPWGAINGAQVPSTPATEKVYGTSSPIVPGQVYGSISDGTGKIFYQHFGDHPYSTDDPTSIGHVVDWFGMTLSGASSNIPSSNQIWQWKDIGGGIAFVGMILFLLALGSLLLKTKFFSGLNDKLPEFKGNRGVWWWVFAIFTAVLGPLTLYNLFLAFFLPNYLHLEGVTTGFVGWLMVQGLITIVVLVAGYFGLARKKDANGVNYGLAWEGKGLDWGKIGKSALLALIVVVSGYIILWLINSWLMVDFRIWLVTLKVTDLSHLLIMLPYLIPTIIYFLPLGVALHGTLRPKDGKVTMTQEILVNVAMLLIGMVILLGYYYIPLEWFGAPATFGPGGLGLINAIPLLVILPVVSIIPTFFFRKTGRVYVGAFMITMFIVWYLVASNAVYSFGG